MSLFQRTAAIASLAHIPILIATFLGHADPTTLESAGWVAMLAANADVPSPPGWPSLPNFLASHLARFIPAIWAILLLSTGAAAIAAGLSARTLQILGMPYPTLWGVILGFSPALLAAPGLGWTLLAGIFPLRILACLGRPGAGALSLYGLSLALIPFLTSAILPALPILGLAGWMAAHGPMRRSTPIATAFFILFPIFMTIMGMGYISWAQGGSFFESLIRLIPTLPPQTLNLSSSIFITIVCLPLLIWPTQRRTRLSRPARLAVCGLASAAILAPTLGWAPPWAIPSLVLPGALFLAGLPDTPLLIRHLGFAIAFIGGLTPALFTPSPSLSSIQQALRGTVPAEAPWRDAIAAAPTLIEPADAALAAFAPPGRLLPPGSTLFRAAESRRWEAPQAIIRNPRRAASRLGHANPTLAIGAPIGYEIILDDGQRQLIRRIQHHQTFNDLQNPASSLDLLPITPTKPTSPAG